jgi:hypothetical protein
MRVLSLGFPMPGARVDNHTFASAPSFFDYDAIAVNPEALSQLVEEVVNGTGDHATRAHEPVVNGPTTPEAVGLAQLLRDRQDETARLLARGGLVVCFAYPNVVHANVTGFAGCDRYFWLPAPPGISYAEPFLRRAWGTELLPVDHDHPFGPYVDTFRGKLAYRAYFDEVTSGFSGAGRVFARSLGNAAIAIELAVYGGRAVFLPPPARLPTGDARYSYSDAIQAAVRNTLGLAAHAKPPAWLSDYQLPGLPERLRTLAAADERLDESSEAVAAAQADIEELERYRRLLWQEGRYGLEQPVRDALALLGFTVNAKNLDVPAELQSADGELAALLEVDAGEEAVGMDGHHRLRRRLEMAIQAGNAKHGLLVINGYRAKQPAQRPPQYEDTLRVAAESMRYCVATTTQLFHATRAALKGDTTTVDAFRQRLLTTEGVMGED